MPLTLREKFIVNKSNKFKQDLTKTTKDQSRKKGRELSTTAEDI